MRRNATWPPCCTRISGHARSVSGSWGDEWFEPTHSALDARSKGAPAHPTTGFTDLAVAQEQTVLRALASGRSEKSELQQKAKADMNGTPPLMSALLVAASIDRLKP